MKFTKSKITCPKLVSYSAVCLFDKKHKLLVNGYIRSLWNSFDFKNIAQLPDEIKKLIVSAYAAENIYIVPRFHGDIYYVNDVDRIIKK